MLLVRGGEGRPAVALMVHVQCYRLPVESGAPGASPY
jgi:hypothetical protein